MKKRKIYKAIPFAILPLLLLTSCNLEANPDGPAITTAINYEEKSRMIYSEDKIYTTPNGKEIRKGDYKPVWQYIQNRLGISLLEHQGAANSGEKKSVAYFRDNWLNKPYADISMGTVYHITNFSVQGNSETILDLKPYMFDDEGKVLPNTKLKNLASFLYNNPAVKMSIMTAKHSHPEQGAIYYVPYFDGFNDMEKMPMVRADFIEDLLDNKLESELDDTDVIIKKNGTRGYYNQQYNPYLGDVAIPISIPNVDNDGKLTEGQPLSVNYTKAKPTDKGTDNIITLQNKLINGEIAGSKATSKQLIKQFKEYFDARYGAPSVSNIFQKYSDLFLGWRACYDTDELIALMRIVKSSARSLGFTYTDGGETYPKEMVTWFPTKFTNQRSADLYRWAGQIFGVRGTESRTSYLYLNGKNDYGEYGTADTVHDCRGDDDIKMMIEQLQALYKEGLLLQQFDTKTATGTQDGNFARELIIEDGAKSTNMVGFMEYCYFQSEGSLNDDQDWVTKEKKEKCNYRPIVGAVTKWDTDNKTDTTKNETDKRDTYMQFSESWASVKTSGLCLNAKLANTPQKLETAFKFIDYIYSPEGQYLYNFGPYTEGYVYPGYFHEDGTPKSQAELKEITTEPKPYIEYQGKLIPRFTEAALDQNNQLDDYLRTYVGATIPMGYEKLSGMSYQLTSTKTQEGIKRVNRAIECKTFKHVCTGEVDAEYPGIEDSKQPFYKIVPSSFYLTKGQSTAIANLLDKARLGSIFNDNTTDRFNIWDYYVMGDKAAYAPEFEEYLPTVRNKWGIDKFVRYYQDAYELMV